jgi:hypothetical protein
MALIHRDDAREAAGDAIEDTIDDGEVDAQRAIPDATLRRRSWITNGGIMGRAAS